MDILSQQLAASSCRQTENRLHSTLDICSKSKTSAPHATYVHVECAADTVWFRMILGWLPPCRLAIYNDYKNFHMGL